MRDSSTAPLHIAVHPAELTSRQRKLYILFRDFLRTRINVGALARIPEPQVTPLSCDRQAPIMSSQRKCPPKRGHSSLGLLGLGGRLRVRQVLRLSREASHLSVAVETTPPPRPRPTTRQCFANSTIKNHPSRSRSYVGISLAEAAVAALAAFR